MMTTHCLPTSRAAVALLLLVALAAGCSSRPKPFTESQLTTPELRALHAKLVTIVDAAEEEPVEWHSGWTGNVWLNLSNPLGSADLGFCHHWQEWVYDGIQSTVEELGWASTGVGINVGRHHEHHAVLVYDPERIELDSILSAPASAPVYVLDAWRYGRPDIYPLAVWVKTPDKVVVPARLEELPYDDDPRIRPSLRTKDWKHRSSAAHSEIESTPAPQRRFARSYASGSSTSSTTPGSSTGTRTD